MDLQLCQGASMASRFVSNMYHPFTGSFVDVNRQRCRTMKFETSPCKLVCSAAQESGAVTVAEKAATAQKPKPAAPVKAAPKDLPVLMEEDVIPSLKSTLEGQEEISQIQLSFSDNRLEGSFLKKDVAHYFWAFFPDGSLTGPKGFALSSYGSEVSTVEPFLIDEKRITSNHVVFWVVKRLAAQGILPVWSEGMN